MGVVGELVQVECEAVSAPPPSGVIWTFMGRTIDTGESLPKVSNHHVYALSTRKRHYL